MRQLVVARVIPSLLCAAYQQADVRDLCIESLKSQDQKEAMVSWGSSDLTVVMAAKIATDAQHKLCQLHCLKDLPTLHSFRQH